MRGVWIFAVALLACRASEEATVEPTGATDDPPPHAILSVPPDLIASGRLHVVAVELRRMGDELVAPATVAAAPDGEARVSAALAGRVTALHVREGEAVEAGQALASLATPDVAKLHGTIASARARRRAAERVVAQEKRLRAANATSERALLEAQSTLGEAKADERAARAQLASYAGAGDEVRSPIDGLIAHRAVALGQQVAPGELLYHVVAASGLEVHARVPLVSVPSVGASATLAPLGYDVSCPAEVAGRGVAVEPGSTRVTVRLRPSPECPPLTVGAFVEARFRIESDAAPVPAVPRSALTELDGVPVVFTATDAEGEFEIAPVDVLRTSRDWVYLGRGVTAGARVVDRGTILLKGEWMRSALE